MARLRHLLALTTLTSCVIDYDVTPKDDNAHPTDDTGFARGLVEAPERLPACEETPSTLPEDAGADESCLFEPTTGDIASRVEWSVSTFGAYPGYDQILMAPVVGQLTDDDGDGARGPGDVPDVVVIAHDPTLPPSRAPSAVLRVLAGDSGRTQTTVHVLRDGDDQLFPYRFSNVALGDVDADGQPELVTLAYVLFGGPEDTRTGGDQDTGSGSSDSGGPDDSGYVPQVRPHPPSPPSDDAGLTCVPMAIEVDGSLAWVARDLLLTCGGHAPSIADLDADGLPEVVIGAAIVSGLDGALLAQGRAGEGRYLAYPEIGMHSVVADLDGDGEQEIIAGNTVYDARAALRCETGGEDGFAAVADLDGDGEGDFVVVGNGRAAVYGADCAPKGEWALSGGGTGGPPTIADFDGDAQPEIGVADAGVYAVYEADGRLLWSAAVSDASSHATGSSVFDFEADGYPEVVYADEEALRIYDGATGAVRLEDRGHSSRTLHELPTIVDVDDDGETEIVVVNGGGHGEVSTTGLYVLGSAEGPWLGNRTVWNQHAYNIVNIDDDLGVPSPPAPNWPDHNNFRSGDPNPVYGGAAPDALPFAATCALECDDGVIVVDVAIGNAGMAPMRAGVPFALYSQRGSVLSLLDGGETAAVLQPGEVSARQTFRLDPAQIPEGVIVIAADESSGTERVNECHEDNNTLTLEGVRCPSR